MTPGSAADEPIATAPVDLGDVPAFRALLAAVRASCTSAPRSAARAVAEAMPPLLADDRWLPAELRAPPAGRSIGQYALAVAPDHAWCVLAVVWAGQATTPVHDHVTWAVSGQLLGSLVEVRYERGVDDPQRVRSHSAILCRTREVHTVVPPFDVHSASNPDGEVAVAIQVYGRDLAVLDRHHFDLVGRQVLTRPTVYDAAPAG
jgi:predicted metal-dependent enzyme (double-stranded beta helix superfamily)